MHPNDRRKLEFKGSRTLATCLRHRVSCSRNDSRSLLSLMDLEGYTVDAVSTGIMNSLFWLHAAAATEGARTEAVADAVAVVAVEVDVGEGIEEDDKVVIAGGGRGGNDGT